MKTIIAGGKNYHLTHQDIKELDKIKKKITEVVSGTARGADQEGEKWAKENNIPIKRFPPNWEKYGRAGGPIRNKQMADYADALVVFPGGSGTENMYSQAVKKGLKIYDFRKLNNFKEWVYQEGFGFDWSQLKYKDLNNLFKNSSKQIQVNLDSNKIIKYLIQSYPNVSAESIKKAFNCLLQKKTPVAVRKKIENILKGPNPQQEIDEIIQNNTKFKNNNIIQNIISLDSGFDKDGIKGLIYFSEEDKPYDLFRLTPINKKETLRLIKPKNNLLLSIKVFYAFKVAPTISPVLNKKISQILEDEPEEDPYVFEHPRSNLNINATEWRDKWNELNSKIKEIDKNIKELNNKISSLPDRYRRTEAQIIKQNQQHVALMVKNYKDQLANGAKWINLVPITGEQHKSDCLNASPPIHGPEFLFDTNDSMFKLISGYSSMHADISSKVDEKIKTKKQIQREKDKLSSVYFKPNHFVGKRNTQKSQRSGTVDIFIDQAKKAFMKIMKNPITKKQKEVQGNLIEYCANIYRKKNPEKKFDLVIYPESTLNDFGENFNKWLSSEFSLMYGCPSLEIKKLPREQFSVDVESAKTFFEFEGYSKEKIEEEINKLKGALNSVKRTGTIKTLTNQEYDFRLFLKMYSNDILKNDLKGKRILVIDDSTTSGSTLQQVSDILSKGKPYSIDFFVPYTRQN